MDPVFIIHSGSGDHDYTELIAWDGLKPVKNKVQADGSGRDYLDAIMYLTNIAKKATVTVSFLRLDGETMKQLEEDTDPDFIDITMLDAKTNTQVRKTYYCTTINEGVQRKAGGKAVYDGVTFNIIER